MNLIITNLAYIFFYSQQFTVAHRKKTGGAAAPSAPPVPAPLKINDYIYKDTEHKYFGC